MGVTQSNSGLFSTPGFIVSPVGKRERGGEKKRREGGKKGIEKERKEGRRNSGGKKERKKKEKKEKKKRSSAGFNLIRLVLRVVLSVEWEGLVGRIGFTFLPS